MTQRKSYSRYFIILQEDEKGYELASDKLPNGYVKLETKNGKCKISFYVQNLKKEMQPYYMVMICGKKKVNKLINLGEIKLDVYGRVDTNIEYPLGNIAETDIAMDKISGAAIVKINSNKIVSIMNGFITKDATKEWKQYEIIKTRNKDVKEENIPKGQHISEIKQSEKHSADLTRDGDIKKEEKDIEEKNIFDEYEKSIEKNKLTETNISKIETVDKDKECNSKKEPENINDEKPVSEDCKTNEDNYRNEIDNDEYPKGRMGIFFKELAKDFEEIKGEIRDIKKCIWYKVKIEKPEDMYNMVDYKKYTVVYYPMMTYYQYISKYGYYLLGYKWDSKGNMKYIIYAIPGIKKEQPYGGQTGFVTWIPKDKEEKIGYWIMFYDFKDCTIAIPVKK